MTLPILNATEDEITIEPYMCLTPYINPKDLETWKAHLAITGIECNPTGGPWVCGGSVRRFLQDEPLLGGDIDYFFVDSFQMSNTLAPLHTHETLVHNKTTNYHSMFVEMIDGNPARKVQLITSWYAPTMEKHLDQFDFSHCQCGWDGQNIYVTKLAYYALKTKQYRIQDTLSHALGSWFRVLKYYTQGYTPHSKDLMTLMELASKELPEEILNLYGQESDNQAIKDIVRPGS